jgi:hypothetical protein
MPWTATNYMTTYNKIKINFNSIKNDFAGENYKNVQKLVKQAKLIRKTGNKHFF